MKKQKKNIEVIDNKDDTIEKEQKVFKTEILKPIEKEEVKQEIKKRPKW